VQEFDALEIGDTVPVEVKTLDGGVQTLSVNSSTSVKELMGAVVRNLEMTNTTDFGIWEVSDQLNHVHYLPKHVFVCDALAEWEKLANEEKEKKATFYFLFKKGWFMKAAEKTRDKNNIKLRYYQAVLDVMDEKQPLTEEEAAFLAALQLKIQGIEPKAIRSGLGSGEATLKKIIPKSVYPLHDQEEWVELITAASQEIKETKEERIMRLYLQTVGKWALYGSAIFRVTMRPKNEELLLALNKDGAHLLKPGSKKPKVTYPYEEISNYAAGKTSFGIVTGSLMRPERLVFNTPQAKEIEEIYHGYVTRANALKARTRRNPRKLEG